jgi:hypothetical protein
MTIHKFQDRKSATPTHARGSSGGGLSVLEAMIKLLDKYDRLSTYWFLEHQFYKPKSKNEKICLLKSDTYNKMFIKIAEKIAYAEKIS